MLCRVDNELYSCFRRTRSANLKADLGTEQFTHTIMKYTLSQPSEWRGIQTTARWDDGRPSHGRPSSRTALWPTERETSPVVIRDTLIEGRVEQTFEKTAKQRRYAAAVPELHCLRLPTNKQRKASKDRLRSKHSTFLILADHEACFKGRDPDPDNQQGIFPPSIKALC